MTRFVPALMLLSLAAPVAAAVKDKVPPATPVGPPASCVDVIGIDHTTVRDDRTIDFFMRGRAVYRNVLPYRCPELGFEQSFAYKVSTSQLCSIDTITVLRHGGSLMQGATCGLGKFQPVTGLAR